MRWSLRLATVSGIGIFVHWTFLLLFPFIFYNYYTEQPGDPPGTALRNALWGVALILSVFVCVVLHELGHALTAKHFGIRTRDITLLPIGGVASLERMPEEPRQELWITVMGPMVNVVIAGVLFLVILVTGSVQGVWEGFAEPSLVMSGLRFLGALMVLNVFLVLFNLLPAFPMDGGRILRAVLAMSMPYHRATRIAARVGQFMAILFAAAALFYSPFLFIIALFVFLGAEAEAQSASMRVAFTGLRVRDGMMTRFRVLRPGDTLRHAASELLAGSQEDFPVVEEGAGSAAGSAAPGASRGRLVGMLPRSVLLKALANGGAGGAEGGEGSVGEAMVRDCPPALEGESIEDAYRRMRELGCAALPVVRAGELVGLISLENISEVIMVRSALEGSPDRAVTG